MKSKNHLFFDLDGTLTPSRQKIKSAMAELLPTLGRTIIVVSGSQNSQIRKQVGEMSIFSLGQNGNQALDNAGNVLWDNVLSPEDKRVVEKHICLIRPLLTHQIPDENDLIEDRGSQLSFSIYGHNAPPAEKKACDGDFKKRRELLLRHPFICDTMEVQIGGSTCFDYFKKGSNKGTNIKRLIETMGWNKDECVYFGDALFPGGNDDTVVGVIDTVKVRDEDDAYQKLRANFLA
jgi:phosphomannomutase